MIKNIFITNKVKNCKKGFSLIELSLGLAVLAILATSFFPSFIKSIQIKAGEKAATEITLIEEAARNYYIDKNSWPPDITNLKTDGYIDPAWITNNPWGNAYLINSNINTFTVSTNVPVEWTKLLASSLPSAVINNSLVSSTISKPGATGLVRGMILEWAGTLVDIPVGWALCDGFNGTPNLTDRFIVGVGSSYVVGETGGESFHTLTIGELPPHSFQYYRQVASGGSNSGAGDWYSDRQDLQNTNVIGMGQAFDNRPLYYALAYIMKL